jgi:hypothetical protein
MATMKRFLSYFWVGLLTFILGVIFWLSFVLGFNNIFGGSSKTTTPLPATEPIRATNCPLANPADFTPPKEYHPPAQIIAHSHGH